MAEPVVEPKAPIEPKAAEPAARAKRSGVADVRPERSSNQQLKRRSSPFSWRQCMAKHAQPVAEARGEQIADPDVIA